MYHNSNSHSQLAEARGETVEGVGHIRKLALLHVSKRRCAELWVGLDTVGFGEAPKEVEPRQA